MPIIKASYTENYFSEQYHKHAFTAGLEQEIPLGGDAAAVYAHLTEQCVRMVKAEIAKLDTKIQARKVAVGASDMAF